MRSTSRSNATASKSKLSRLVLSETLTHACAALTLGYVLRSAAYNSTWIEIELLEQDPGPLPLVSIVVPARNEERSIEACVRSLCTQRWVRSEVIVVDDRSADGTSRILEDLANEFPLLRVVRGEPLPSGWVGKPWALAQGARHAVGAWLLFTDADGVHAAAGVASALHVALAARADALTIVTGQELGSFWERAVLPSVLGMILFASGTFGELNDSTKPKQALANGQYILVRREAYEALGGHAALRDQIIEDVVFARRLKADGRFRLLVADGHTFARVRMYRSLGEIWLGFTKNVYAGADGRLATLAGGLLFLACLSVAPLALAAYALATRRYVQAAEALACTFATVSVSAWSFRRAGVSWKLALFQPFGCAMLGAITLNSTWRILSGRGVEWRGRRYSGH